MNHTANATHLTPVEIPVACPVCGWDLEMQGKHLMCPNIGGCPAQRVGALLIWLGKLEIKDWGGAAASALVAADLVNDVSDLYVLDEDRLSGLELNGRRVGSTAATMLRNLHSKKHLPLHLIVGSLGIPLCARSTCEVLVAAGYDTLDKMYAAVEEDLVEIKGIGDGRARAFVRGIAARRGLLGRLLARGVTVKARAQGGMTGFSMCISGFRDSSMEEAFTAQGGTVKGSVSRDLTWVVLKDPASTSGKAKAARAAGVKVVGIEEMWALLGGRP